MIARSRAARKSALVGSPTDRPLETSPQSTSAFDQGCYHVEGAMLRQVSQVGMSAVRSVMAVAPIPLNVLYCSILEDRTGSARA